MMFRAVLFVVVFITGCNLPFHFTEVPEENQCPYYARVEEVAESQDREKLETAYKVFSGIAEFLETATDEELSKLSTADVLKIVARVQEDDGLRQEDAVFDDEFDEIMEENGLEEDNIQFAKLNEEVSYKGEKFYPVDRLVKVYNCFAEVCSKVASEK